MKKSPEMAEESSFRQPIVRLTASELVPGRLGREFHRGAAAVVIEGNPAVRSLWDGLMADPDRLPWTSTLMELSRNLRASDDLTECIGDVFYFKPFRHSYIARKIEICGSSDGSMAVFPPRFSHDDRSDPPAPDLMAGCWQFSRDVLLSMGPALPGLSDPAVTFRGVLQQIKYQDSASAHQAVFGMMRNALGPWARIGYVLDQRREQMRPPFARRGMCDFLALLSFVPVVGSRLVRWLNAALAPFDKRAALPPDHNLIVKAHIDSRYFAALCGTRDNIVTQVFAGGKWLDLPINREDITIVPGLHAKTAFGIEPTLHRVLQSSRGMDAGGDWRMHNVTLLLGAK